MLYFVDVADDHTALTSGKGTSAVNSRVDVQGSRSLDTHISTDITLVSVTAEQSTVSQSSSQLRRKETISVNNPCTHHMRVDYSTYEGIEVQGFSETVISRGKIVVKDTEYVGKKGDGQFIKRGFYSGIK